MCFAVHLRSKRWKPPSIDIDIRIGIFIGVFVLCRCPRSIHRRRRRRRLDWIGFQATGNLDFKIKYEKQVKRFTVLIEKVMMIIEGIRLGG